MHAIALQTAKMILLSKTKTNIVEIDDTRPISFLPPFSKLYEKVFLNHFNHWIVENRTLPNKQTGFRTGHNMAIRLVSIINQIEQSLTVNTAAAGLIVDFKGASNQLWFNGRMLKLSNLGCPTYLMAWLRRYLSGRTAYISINGTTTSTFSIYKGVPQGFCVGPVTFTVHHYGILNSMSMRH